MELKIWLAYLITEFLLCITPGPAVMLVSSQGLKYGARASYFGSLGISSGNFIYFILSALGLGTLILTTGNLFEYIKIAGAIYLIWTGLIMFYYSYKQIGSISPNTELSQNNFKSFTMGFITQAANPKAIIFFVALLPQFVNPNRSILFQFVVFGFTTIIMETLILMFYGWLGARGKKLAGQNKVFIKWQDRIAGTALIGIGINLFFIKRAA